MIAWSKQRRLVGILGAFWDSTGIDRALAASRGVASFVKNARPNVTGKQENYALAA